jgi:hypothetical protein
MRPDGVVVLASGLDQDARLASGAEPFGIQALVAQAAVEALVGAVLPRLAGLDVHGLDPVLGDPLQDRQRHELGAVVAAHERRCAAFAHQPGQDLDHPRRSDRACYVDRQALAGELVDHGQALDLLAVGARVEHEVVRPDVVGGSGALQPVPGAGDPVPAPLGRQLQLRLGPDPLSAARARRVPLSTEEDADAAIAVPRIQPGEPLHGRDHRHVLGVEDRCVLQCRTGDADQPARASLRDTAVDEESDLQTTGGQARHFRRTTSRIASISRSRSASSFSSFALSASSVFIFLTSFGSRPAKCWRHE